MLFSEVDGLRDELEWGYEMSFCWAVLEMYHAQAAEE